MGIVVNYNKDNNIEITGEDFLLNLEGPRITLENMELNSLKFVKENTEQSSIGSLNGNITNEYCVIHSIRVGRHIFVSCDGILTAIKISIENLSDKNVYINTISPFICRQNNSIVLAKQTFEAFRCLKLGRHKTDIPSVFRPSIIDDDYLDASFQASKMVAGGGVQGELDKFFKKDIIVSEPLFYIKNDKNPNKNGILFASLDQKTHLSNFYLVPSKDNKELDEFGAVCEFDGILVEPNEKLSTHFISLSEALNETDALDFYSNLCIDIHNIKKPKDRKTLYCSWYFYGLEFSEKDLDENLKHLKENPMPIDAFIIDNGWMDNFGDWNPNSKFPNGMDKVSKKISDSGMLPGIWTCPFLLMPHSKAFKNNPDLAIKTKTGEYATFQYSECECYITDPTNPSCQDYYNKLFEKLKNWGFVYHKLDFMRALVSNENIVFYDSHDHRPCRWLALPP